MLFGCYMLVPRKTAAVSVHVLWLPYTHLPVYSVISFEAPFTSLQCHFIRSHTCRVHVCLAGTCHLHFWQNDWDLLHATAVTLGSNGYRNKSQQKYLTLEKKILPPLLRGLEPGTFGSRVRLSNYWAIPSSQVGQVTKM